MSASSQRNQKVLFLFFFLLNIGLVFIEGCTPESEPKKIDGKYSAVPLASEKTVAPISSLIEKSHDTAAHINAKRDTALAEAKYALDLEQPTIKSNARRINIAIIGIDSRLGDNHVKHADANHILSIIPDSGKIEITSIPRDTYADAGYDDTTGLNKLTLVYANRGLKSYVKEATRIAGLDKIDYWVEAGFSQAMGVIELFGHKDSKSALQVLRSRQGLGGDDFQRCYNQGQFIRQNILKHFNKFDGISGDLMLRGGLLLVNTNLSKEKADEIFSDLKSHGFPKDTNAITVRVRPRALPKYKVYDFSKEDTYQQLKNKIERYNDYRSKHDTSFSKSKSSDLYNRLSSIIKQAQTDSIKRPQLTINKLRPYYEQRAWLQIQEASKRDEIRNSVQSLLGNAYERLKKHDESEKVRTTLEYERKLFSPEK